MATATQLVLWTCCLSFGTFVRGENNSPVYPSIKDSLACGENIGVISIPLDNRTGGEMDGSDPTLRDPSRYPALIEAMRQVVIKLKERGINCLFNETSYKLHSCNDTNLDPLQDKDIYNNGQGNRKMPPPKFIGIDVLKAVFILLSIMVFLIIVSWVFQVFVSKAALPSERQDQN